MDLGLKGKVAIVTGGGAGIGAGMCETFAQEGCNVVIADFRPLEDTQAQAKYLEETYGIQALPVRIDVSNPDWMDQLRVTDSLIRELGVEATPRIEVYNKCDRCTSQELPRKNDAVCISAVTGEGLDELKKRMFQLLTAGEKAVTFLLPYERGGELDAGIRVCAVCTPEVYGRLREYVVNDE